MSQHKFNYLIKILLIGESTSRKTVFLLKCKIIHLQKAILQQKVLILQLFYKYK